MQILVRISIFLCIQADDRIYFVHDPIFFHIEECIYEECIFVHDPVFLFDLPSFALINGIRLTTHSC